MKIKPTLFIWSIFLLAAFIFTPSLSPAEAAVADIQACTSGLFAGGDGTLGSPYQIANATQLENVTFCSDDLNVGKYFILTSDINLSGFTNRYDAGQWIPIGSWIEESAYFEGSFNGHFNGNYHIIRNLSITRDESAQGLFGVVNDAGSIQNLGINNFTITGAGTGAIAGELYGSIEKSYVKNSTIASIGWRTAGGMAGTMGGTAVIEDSYVSNVIVRGNDESTAGGITGFTNSGLSIERVYVQGDISIEDPDPASVGGIAGGWYDSGTINDSFSVASLSIDNTLDDPVIGGIAGKWGEALGANNYWYVPVVDGVENCLHNQINNPEFCTPIADVTEFKNAENEPLLSWNIATTDDVEYEDFNDGYPFLAWERDGMDAESTWLIHGIVSEPPVLTPINELSGTIKAKDATYTFRTTAACEIHASEIETNSNKEVELLFEEATTDRDINATIRGLESGKTYSFTFGCFDEDENESNTLTVGPFTIAKASGVSGYASTSYLASQGIRLDTKESSESSSSKSEKQMCPVDTLIHQDMRAPARNGVYNNYTKAIVTEVKLLQGHMNRLGFNSGPEDGILGKLTDGAIKRMQIFLGTDPDGMVGPITRGLINNSCGSGGLLKA